jgi:hypothetical protein
MKKILIALSIFFISCEKEEIRPFPCLDGNCGYQFAVDTFSSPGAKLYPDGYWRVKHNGINYFTIRGLISQLHPAYVVNKVPMVETKYDSDYWIVFDTIQFSTPMYGYMGWFNDKTLNNPIPIGNHVFTINYLKSITSIFNLAGYTVSRNMCLDCPYTETLLGTYSKYNYTPTQNIFFDNEMIGDTATIYIQMTFNSDTGPRVIKNHEMKFIFL